MRVAIPVKGNKDEEMLDDRFGRCERFLYIDTRSGKRYSKANEAKGMGGAGIMAAQSVVSEDVNILITPDLGPNAFKVISAARIDVYQARGGLVNDLLKDLEDGKLVKSSKPTVEGHHVS